MKFSEDNDGEQQNFLQTLRHHLLKSKRGLLPIIVFLLTLMALNRPTSYIRNFQQDQRDAQRQTVNQVQHQLPESKASTSRPTNYLLYVVTLQGVERAGDSNIGRYDNFKRHWNIICHQDDQHQERFHFHTCPGHLGPKGTVKGYGLSLAYLDCFHWALKNHKEWHREHNQHNPTAEGLDDDGIPFVFLEDDARLYNSNFCYSEYRNRIWQSLPQTNSTLLMLGGHTMAFDDTSHPIAQAYQDHYYDENLLMDPSVLPQFIHPRRGFGSYGFVLLNTPSVEYMSRKMDKMLNRTFDAKGMKGFKAIDQQFHHYGVLKTVMSHPWLVYHEGGLYSNTKGGIRGEFGDGSKQYRWINGLTGSGKNCSGSGDENASSNSETIHLSATRDDEYQEGTVLVSCSIVSFRIPSYFSSQSNNTSTSDMILTAVVSINNHTDKRAVSHRVQSGCSINMRNTSFLLVFSFLAVDSIYMGESFCRCIFSRGRTLGGDSFRVSRASRHRLG